MSSGVAPGREQRRQSGLDEYVRRFLPGPVVGMVVLVKRRHVERGRAVGRHADFYLWLLGELLTAHCSLFN